MLLLHIHLSQSKTALPPPPHHPNSKYRDLYCLLLEKRHCNNGRPILNALAYGLRGRLLERVVAEATERAADGDGECLP